jgi:hypothetical protein
MHSTRVRVRAHSTFSHLTQAISLIFVLFGYLLLNQIFSAETFLGCKK